MTNLYQTRLEGLVDAAEYYLWMDFSTPDKQWTQEQTEDMKHIADTLCCFGEVGEILANELRELYERQNTGNVLSA